MDKKNSLIFSVTYKNYMNNILNDKENKSLGQWEIIPEMIDQLKYAYAYLTNSNQMVVKKYEIERFEYENVEKGYDHKGKYCFVFKKSEDVFFEYPYSPVQGRHYRNDEEMDALPRIEKSEADSRLEASRTTKSYNNTSTKKSGIENDAQTKLSNIWKEENIFGKSWIHWDVNIGKIRLDFLFGPKYRKNLKMEKNILIGY